MTPTQVASRLQFRRGEAASSRLSRISNRATSRKESWAGRLSPTTRRRYESILDKYLAPEFGRVAIGRITHEVVQRYINRLAADPELAPGTVRNVYAVFRTAITKGVRMGLVRINPCAAIDLPRPRREEMLFLTADENEAAQGPLAMISPSNTFTFLTRPYPGFPPSELETIYPSGERNFVRIAAANHLQAVADIELAKELGAERVFLLGDNEEGDGMPADARKAARNLGLDVVGAAGWDAEARDFASLARRIARTRPEAVVIFGTYRQNEGALIRDLRDALGPEVPLIAGDGFMPSEGLVNLAGPAARGMYLGVYGLPNGELPPSGARFLEEFEAAQGGGPTPSYTATYGAQAMEIVLDAIARSDGTRPSVTRELQRTTVEDGILGDIRFDENGDLVEGPLTFFRAVGSRQPGSTILAGYEGLAFDRVIMARADLLR